MAQLPSRKRERVELDTYMTDGEVLAHAQEAASIQQRRFDKQEALEAYSKGERAEIKDMARDETSHLTKVHSRKEPRLVEVEITRDFKGNTVTIIRLDTGEQVSQRAMTWEERQDTLFQIPADSDAEGDGDAASEVMDAVVDAINEGELGEDVTAERTD